MTKEQFEQEVPAFRTPGGEEDNDVWAAMQTHLREAAAHLRERYGIALPGEAAAAPEEASPTGTDTEGAALHLVCVRAARHAMAGADLVLTPTGFGVVSNQNVAPASPARVQALAEELRRDESRTADRLAFLLLQGGSREWLSGPEARSLFGGLLWCPTLLRRYGVTAEGGGEPFAEEYRAMLPRLREAEERVARLVSPELVQALIDGQLAPPDEDSAAADTAAPRVPYGGRTAYALVLEAARRYMASLLTCAAHPRAPHALAARLLDTVRRHAAELPEWQGSATREAAELPRYENRRQDPCFFWS